MREACRRVFLRTVGWGVPILLIRQTEAKDASSLGREVEGWPVRIHPSLQAKASAAQTERALELLRGQLDEIRRVVPEKAVTKLREVTLWISPEYPGTPPRAEYHPDAGWLRENGRSEAMARGVEFTNVRIFEAETRRMPNFALHELAHAYHHRELPDGFDNQDIKEAHARAIAGGTYDRIERQDSEGRRTIDRAYALTTPQEYFAELTEAFFSRNDFFPFDHEELKAHDPVGYALIDRLWKL